MRPLGNFPCPRFGGPHPHPHPCIPLPRPYLFMTPFCWGDCGGARTRARVQRPEDSAQGSGSRWGGGVRLRGGGSNSSGGSSSCGGGDLLPVPGSVSPSSSLVLTCPVCPPRLRPPGLGEDEATHVALEVGPRTLRRLSGCPLAAPTPRGSPLHPPGCPPLLPQPRLLPQFMCPIPPLPGSFAPLCFVPSAPPSLQRLCLSVCLGHL